MHLRSLKKTKKDVSLHDPIGTDKEGNECNIKRYLLWISGERRDELLRQENENFQTEVIASLMLFFGIYYFFDDLF
ncbi:RNA polymerase sporulation-specific sigma factor [Aneurinibacillus thermoaerophilus]|uniref:RNA polymerase sporulation-specific sigma factor n=1 Tax=Aneurinibacillus thermoaerophilus TaxID=143495 RepID=A0A1G7YFN9_ANETH|nr:RNA polymerase sporulation-specific sigma factor [Aneurinibacillus thermoaerophilus]